VDDGVSRIALVGFSMGGNLVLKTAGEWGTEAPPEFRAVVAVCPAMDLAASADALHLPGNRIYEAYFMHKLRRRFRDKAKLFPGQFDVTRLRGLRSLRQFDDKITAFYCGFEGAVDYYAANDPFVRLIPETRKKIAANRNLTFVEADDGGHCSFIADANGYDGRWAERQVIDFLQQF
jgi:hypothetical protein